MVLGVAQQNEKVPSYPATGEPIATPPSESTVSAPCLALAADDSQMTPLAKVCEFALTFRSHLPDFTCGQTTVSPTAQQVEVQVTYLHGKGTIFGCMRRAANPYQLVAS